MNIPLLGAQRSRYEALGKAEPLPPGFSLDFQRWLNSRGYGHYEFARKGAKGQGYGGKQSRGDKSLRVPIVFIHGNSDAALGASHDPRFTGWTASIREAMKRGYQSQDLYAFTWGPADRTQSRKQYHSKKYLEESRAFIQAVREYTGSPVVNVISHSMGVTLGRGAIEGGMAYDEAAGGWYQVGEPLTEMVDTFVGIAGGNQGLVKSLAAPQLPCNSALNGFYPGYAPGPLAPVGQSVFLQNLNLNAQADGGHVFTIWTPKDEILGEPIVWGRYTSQIPGQDGELRLEGPQYNHFAAKELTTKEQMDLVEDHECEGLSTEPLMP